MFWTVVFSLRMVQLNFPFHSSLYNIYIYIYIYKALSIFFISSRPISDWLHEISSSKIESNIIYCVPYLCKQDCWRSTILHVMVMLTKTWMVVSLYEGFIWKYLAIHFSFKSCNCGLITKQKEIIWEKRWGRK